MTVPVIALVRHWSHGTIALCGAETGSRTTTAALVTCPLCRLEVGARMESWRRVHRLVRRTAHR